MIEDRALRRPARSSRYFRRECVCSTFCTASKGLRITTTTKAFCSKICCGYS